MIRKNVKLITDTIDQDRLYQTVQEVAVHHRIQGSPGYRAAAERLCQKLIRQGIDAEVLAFPADEDAVFDTYPSFQEWSCRAAWCDMTYPDYRRIADFDRNAISVIQKSVPCDYRDKPLDVILMKYGSNPAAYEGVDLRGKILFIRDDYNAYYDWAIVERGALGFICDQVMTDPYVRGRYDQLDTVKYTSFFWQKGETRAFGFMLSPREGDRLEAACLAAEKAGSCVQVNCYIDAALYNGTLEDVMAFLPGEADEEIIITAHLCHPRASANDNATGVAAALELMRTLRDLTGCGKLPPLKRGIRMLLVPEFTGTYAYIDRVKDTRHNIMAGFNLDMIGGGQSGGYGPITITDLPYSSPSFVTDVAAFVLEEIKREVPNNSGQWVPMFNSVISKYSGGSDHLILSDPGVGIPTLMLGQWPDKFYHTSSDTVDRVDPHILSKSCAIATAYAYTLANLEEKDIPSITAVAIARLASDIGALYAGRDQGSIREADYPSLVRRRTRFAVDGLADYPRFFPVDAKARVEALAVREGGRLTQVASLVAGIDASGQPDSVIPDNLRARHNYVPVRNHFTTVQLRKLSKSFTPEQNRALADFNKNHAPKVGGMAIMSLMFYIDGRRTAADLADCAYYDNGRTDMEAIDIYLKLLRDLGYVTF